MTSYASGLSEMDLDSRVGAYLVFFNVEEAGTVRLVSGYLPWVFTLP